MCHLETVLHLIPNQLALDGLHEDKDFRSSWSCFKHEDTSPWPNVQQDTDTSAVEMI